MQYRHDSLPADQHDTALDAIRISEMFLGISGIYIDFMTEADDIETRFPCGTKYLVGSDHLLGSLAVDNGKPRIFIHSKCRGENLFFTICHEIWHAYEYLTGDNSDYETSEMNADLFAWKCVDYWRNTRPLKPLLPELKIKENDIHADCTISQRKVSY